VASWYCYSNDNSFRRWSFSNCTGEHLFLDCFPINAHFIYAGICLDVGSEICNFPSESVWQTPEVIYKCYIYWCIYYCYRGVLSVAWCPQDSDLLLTAAKDNRVLCWNPNSSQPGGEVSTKHIQWHIWPVNL